MSINLTKEEIVSLSYLPPRSFCAVYFLVAGNDLVYIGQSENYPARIAAHSLTKTIVFDKYFHVECMPEDLKKMEREFILKHLPKYNKESYVKKARAKNARDAAQKREFDTMIDGTDY